MSPWWLVLIIPAAALFGFCLRMAIEDFDEFVKDFETFEGPSGDGFGF